LGVINCDEWIALAGFDAQFLCCAVVPVLQTERVWSELSTEVRQRDAGRY